MFHKKSLIEVDGNGPDVLGPPNDWKRYKLVDFNTKSVKLKHASLRRTDTTSSFREAFEQQLRQPPVEIKDDILLSLAPVNQFRDSYWRRECFSKLDIASEAEVERLESAAIEKLLAREVLNVDINERLRRFALTGKGLHPETAAAVRQAKKIVARILGPFSWNRCVKFCRWGPGATTEFGRASSSPQNKWAVASHITQECLPLLEAYSQWCGWDFPFTVVDHNCITTVPKKTTARRTIAMEPSWNIFFQLAVETAIRRCLQRVGLLVDSWRTAQEHHQRLARAGSYQPLLFPTLDFADASNSVTKGLCGLLIPTDWLVALRTVRVNNSKLPNGTKIPLEMFSTMGNGFTFVLMTLLIYAVSTAVVGSPTSVFGDDLILPDARRYDVVVAVFAELGFVLNQDKSFYAGLFRESCGGHYFNGHDVTPPYFKKKLDLLPAYISYANAITRRAVTLPGAGSLHETLLSSIPRKNRGPEGYGDSVAVTSWDRATPRWRPETQSWYGTTLIGYQPNREGPIWGRLRNDLYPYKVGQGPEVYKAPQDLYRTGEWSSTGW